MRIATASIAAVVAMSRLAQAQSVGPTRSYSAFDLQAGKITIGGIPDPGVRVQPVLRGRGHRRRAARRRAHRERPGRRARPDGDPDRSTYVAGAAIVLNISPSFFKFANGVGK